MMTFMSACQYAIEIWEQILNYLKEEIFAGLMFAILFSGHFAGINCRELSFTEDFSGINFRELGLTKDFMGINFCRCNLYKYLEGIKFVFTLRKIFPRP